MQKKEDLIKAPYLQNDIKCYYLLLSLGNVLGLGWNSPNSISKALPGED